MKKFLLTAYLAVLLLGNSAEAIEVDCFYEGDRNKISCRCVNAGRPEMVQSQDISTIISSFTSEFRRPSFSHVELRQCSSLDVILDLRAFVVNGELQNISDISFDRIGELRINIQNIDFGHKRFVFNDVNYLTISGNLDNPSTSVLMYIRNSQPRRGDVIFQDFYARSRIPLINIQDARSVRVVNSYFENLGVAEVLRTEHCYVTLTGQHEVDCTMGDLFFNSWSTASLYYVVNHPLFIAGIILLILLILLIVFVCCYSTYWKKKKEIELLGYPASTISRSVPVHLNSPPMRSPPLRTERTPSSVGRRFE